VYPAHRGKIPGVSEEGPVSDEGGDAPCWAHLVDGEEPFGDAALARLVRDLADAVVVADSRGRIAVWNASAERIFGWTSDEALGQSLELIIPPRFRERHWAGFDRTMTTGETSYATTLLEVPALHRDGRTLSIAFTVTLLRSTAGTITGIAAVVRDDTVRWQERRELQAELTRLRGAG
jgi:PAS domain S-box-containing protein